MTRADLRLPRLYAILDAESVASRGGELLATAVALHRAGVRLVQYRDKQGSTDAVLANARAIAAIFAHSHALLILNDHAELVRAAGWHGVHLGQEDLSPTEARRFVGEGVVGLSTHTLAQAIVAEREKDVDYVAFGPMYATATKRNPEAVVGVPRLREVRARVSKPLVAIGGINAQRIPEVLGAGADSVAVISALFGRDGVIETSTRELARIARG